MLVNLGLLKKNFYSKQLIVIHLEVNLAK